ncbi:MAG TPA: hypothetical protein VNH42_00525 [Mariprofundaceae bacterium]|nr:hypothetical protein [Mariprofundaceae bacterium]
MHPVKTRLSSPRIAAVWAGVLMCMFSHAPQAVAREGITAGITPSYYSGKYGTNNTTDILYVPLDIKADTGNLTLKVTIPYIRVHSQGAVIAGGAVIGNTGGQPTTRSGLGDIWLEARYRIDLDNRGNSISPYAKVKFGTASRANGLGTGANDVEFGGRFRARVGDRFFPFAQLGYRIHGQAANLVLNDILTYQAGFSYLVNVDNVATLLYAGHESSQPGLAPASEIIGAWNVKAGRDTDLQVFGLVGLSNGSPDYGGGLSYMYHF